MNPPADAEDTGSVPSLGKSPGEGKWQPIPVFSPGESQEETGGLQSVGS